MDAARTQIGNFTDRNGCYVKVMLIEPTAVIFNGSIIGDSDTRAGRRYPCGQQPQVMTQMAGKRRCRIIVRPMGQRQVMLRIKKINLLHLTAKVTIILTKCKKF